MATSKNGKNYYTKEQYQYAKYQASALEYALSKGYQLISKGQYYTMPKHDSMVFAPNGMWYWNSRGLKGKALDFMLQYEGKNLVDAILELAGDKEPAQLAPPKQSPPPPEKPRQFISLPEPSDTNRRLYAYLCKERKLDYKVVSRLVNDGLLYEGLNRQGEKVQHNAVFVYRNPEGEVIGAFARGLTSTSTYKRDIRGSDKSFGWMIPHPSREPEALYVFEACIDAASHMTLSPWEKADRLSLEGLAPKPLLNYLVNHPEVKRVVFCLDNDLAGRAATQRLAQRLEGVEVMVQIPPTGKDWNDYLKSGGQKLPQPEVFLPLSNTPEMEI